MMDLNELYKVILANAGMKADDEGFVSMADDNAPVLIDGKRLVLPVRTQLAQPNLGNRVVFHPLHESLIRGESDVMTRTREMINARLNISFSYIALCLLTLATSPAQHVSLAPDQTIFLDALKDIDEDVIESYQKILDAMSVSQDGKCFARIYVKPGGMYQGRKVQRLAVVSFPLYEELIKRPAAGEPNTVFGVRLKKKSHRDCLINLIEYMVPNIGVENHYDRGSDSTVAPRVDCVMQATRALGGLVNEMCDLFGEKIIPDRDSMKYPMDWIETFDNLPAYQAKINLVPSQPGNEGKLAGGGNKQIEVPQSIVSAPAPKQEAPWDGENQLAPVAPAPEPVQEDTIFGPRPPAAPRPALGAPASRTVQHLAPQVHAPQAQPQQQQRPFNPGVVMQSHNRFLPNYVPPAHGANGYGQSPFGTPQYGQPVQRRHVPSWAGGNGPGYSNGYGQGGGNNGGGFGNI